MRKYSLLNLYFNSINKFSSNILFRLPNNKTYTYKQVDNLTNKYKYIFNQCNLKKLDNIIFIGNNSPDWFSCNIASLQFGCRFIPIYLSQHIDTIKYIINETKPKLIITESNSNTNSYFNNLQDCKTFINSSNPPIIKYNKIDFNTIGELTTVKNTPSSNDINLILYTSGTTGLSKGVCLTNDNLYSNIKSIDNLVGKDFISSNDKYFNFLPWSHIYGLNCELYYAMSKGSSIFINDYIENLVSNMKKSEPSIICTVPKLLYSIYDKIEKNKISKFLTNDKLVPYTGNYIKNKIFGPNLRFLNTGGAAVSEELLNFYTKIGIDVYQGYGLSETSPMISLNYNNNNKLGSVGKILDCNDVKIIDNEICVKGTNVFSGYYNNKEETKNSFNKNNYFRTGDLGYIDNENYLFITGRIKDLYKLDNGKYINPIQIENILMESEIITQVFIYGDNKPFNIALIVSDSDEKEILNEIYKYSPKIKKYEIPKKIIKVKAFTFEDKLLTPKMSMIRKNIYFKYKNSIEQLYK